MNDIVDAITAILGKTNPLLAVAVLGVWVVFGDKIKSLLGKIPLPKLPGGTPSPVPVPTPDSTPDAVNKWLEAHPLLDRVWIKAKELFADKVLTGKLDEDTTYALILKALKDAADAAEKAK